MSASQATSPLASTHAGPLTARIAAEFAAARAGSSHAGDAHAAGARAGGEPLHGDAERSGASQAPATRPEAALRALMAGGLPTSRDENWKYVNLRPLEKARFVPPSAAVRPVITTADLPAAVGKSRYVFVDGVLEPSLSTMTAVPGVVVTSARGATTVGGANGVGAALGHGVADIGRATGGANGAAGDAAGAVSAANGAAVTADLRFALLNEAFATDGVQIHVARGTDCATCVELVFVATADATAGTSYPRMSLRVDSNARVGLIERHISFGSNANFINCAVDVEVGRDAVVQHYRVQQTGARAIWFDTLTANLAENARYQVHSVNQGALCARSTVYVKLLGERSEVGVFGASVGAKNQVHDTFALVDHIAPNARTEQSFRGIAGGRARVAFNGKIVVRKGAHGTDSSQSLRGLLAGTDAEIDVRPQLEIYTDDVRCNHGATAGTLDDNMLFYLLSRGLDRETALRLLKWAFLEDVVSKIEVPELRRQIEESLAGQMNESAALSDALAGVPPAKDGMKGEPAALAQKGATHALHGQGREPLPRVDGERAAPAQKENL